MYKGNLCTNQRRIEASGSHQDHPQDLDLDQDLLICHLDVGDEVKCLMLKSIFIRISVPLFRIYFDGFIDAGCTAGLLAMHFWAYVQFLQFIRTFTKTCRLLKSLKVL